MKAENTSLISSLFHEKPWYQTSEKSILSYLLSISASTLEKFPYFLKKSLTRWIDEVGLFIIRLFKIYPLNKQPYHYIQTVNKQNQKITILYQGDLPSLMFFLKKISLNFDNLIDTIVENKKTNKKRIEELKKQVDVFIVEKDYFFRGYFQKRNFLVLPENITFTLTMDDSVEKMIQQCAQSIQNDIKKARSYGYSQDISDRMTDFSLFYEKMYLPYTNWKYKDVKKVISYNAMKHYFLRGANILFVKKNDNPIFGGIYEIFKKKIITHYAGLMQGKFDHIHNGIITLSYYYLLKIAKKHQVSKIDFGTSPPFLLDGLCSYKMKWNMQITKTKPIFSTIFAFKIHEKSDKIMKFFKENPFFYYKNDTLAVAYFVEKAEDGTIKNKIILKHNSLKGIEPTLFHSITDLLDQHNNL